jgi:nitrite reductase/ring-hydroxylating ferredoxin subunit
METAEAAGSPQSASRRKLLKSVGRGLAGIVSLGVIFGALGFIFPPLRRWVRLPRFGSTRRPIAAIESFRPGEWKLVGFPLSPDESPDVRQQRQLWILRDADRPETFRIISAACTHMGCVVKWKADRKLFVCPCHGGTFDSDGARKSGPPQRPLDVFPYQIKDGQLVLDERK